MNSRNLNLQLKLLTCIFLMLLTLISCDKDNMNVDTPLNIDLSQVPYANLSDYGFFVGDLKELNPAIGVHPYALSSTLFSDYASKERFIYLPEGTSMEFKDEFDVLDFPTGAIIIKNFYYWVDTRDKTLGRRIIETRLLVKNETKWKPYAYKWNTEQTQASRLIVGGTLSASTILGNGEVKNIGGYVIPRELDCRTCHNLNEKMAPIGPKPSSLNRLSETEPSINQLDDWTTKGILIGVPSTVNQIPDYRETALDPITRGRAYLDANCGFCHRQGGTANANGLYINWNFEGNEINTGIYKIPTNFNAPQLQYDIVPGNPDESILYYRMTQTTTPAIMPQIGRSINHDEGIEIIRDYILNL